MKENKNTTGSHNSRDMILLGGVIIIILIIFVSVFIMFFSSLGNESFSIEEQFEEFSTGWNISTGELQGDSSLPVWVDVKGEEDIILTKQLPNDIVDFAGLVTRNYHQVITVSVDGEEIYKYPDPYNWYNSFVISDSWQVIPIAQDMAGKIIEVKFTAHPIGFSGMIRPIYYGQRNSVMQHIRNKYMVMFALGLSVLLAGFTLLSMGIFYGKYYKNKSRPLIGMMLAICGIWLTGRAKMPILGMGNNITFFTSFVSLLVVAIVEFLYCRERFKGKNVVPGITKEPQPTMHPKESAQTLKGDRYLFNI